MESSRPNALHSSPVMCACYVRAKILMMVAPEDEMVHANFVVARFANKLMPDPKVSRDTCDRTSDYFTAGRRF